MAYITFKNPTIHQVAIPYWFVTDYMPEAHGGYVKVYLYLLAFHQSPTDSIALEDVAKKLDMLHSELMLALQYWDEKKVVQFNVLEDETFELTFVFDKPSTPPSKPNVVAAPKMHMQQTRPHYSLDELNLYKKQHQSISNLFLTCEQSLGRLLSNTDQQVLFGLYDWLNMPLDLIAFLVDYCVSNGHSRIRYIEKVALGWIEQDITTIEAAKLQTAVAKQYRQILKSLGRSGETITKHERELLNNWLKDFDIELILEACRRTVTQASSPSLNYLGSILDSWSKNNVKSLQDVEALDKNRTPKTEAPSRQSKPKNKSFTSIYSHNWDLDELERRASDYMEQNLYSPNDRNNNH